MTSSVVCNGHAGRWTTETDDDDDVDVSPRRYVIMHIHQSRDQPCRNRHTLRPPYHYTGDPQKSNATVLTADICKTLDINLYGLC